MESHDCIHELVEDISQGPPTRTLLRLQSLGTDYGSDEFGACTSSEETGQAKDEEMSMSTVEFLIDLHFVNYLPNISYFLLSQFKFLEEIEQAEADSASQRFWKNRNGLSFFRVYSP